MKPLFTLFLALMMAVPALAQDDLKIPLIEVEGFSERKLAPDEAVFSIQLEEKSMKVNDAVKVLNTKSNNLAEALKKAKIKDYKLFADNYAVNINRIYRGGYARDSGYIASQNLRIVTKSTNEDLQKIVEAIQGAGDMSFNLSFQVSEATQKSLDDTLLVDALKNAESRALLISQTLNIKSIRVHRVTLEATPMPFLKNQMLMRAETSDAQVLISPDEQSIQKRVYVKYTY